MVLLRKSPRRKKFSKSTVEISDYTSTRSYDFLVANSHTLGLQFRAPRLVILHTKFEISKKSIAYKISRLLLYNSFAPKTGNFYDGITFYENNLQRVLTFEGSGVWRGCAGGVFRGTQLDKVPHEGVLRRVCTQIVCTTCQRVVHAFLV